jgi:hypothetical protein
MSASLQLEGVAELRRALEDASDDLVDRTIHPVIAAADRAHRDARPAARHIDRVLGAVRIGEQGRARHVVQRHL